MTAKKDEIAIPTDDEVARYAPEASASEPPSGSEAAPAEDSTVESLKAELDACKDRLLRSQAECANIARRLNQQHAESWKYASADLARSLLPVLDSLEKTVNALGKEDAAGPLAEGVRLIAEQLAKALRDHGVQPIEAVGRPFDPARHEALMQDRQSDRPPGTVTAEMQRGYVIHDRVLRPARVAVAAGPAEGAQANEAADAGSGDAYASS
jgi:molecular chaperone GrpE